MRHGRGARARRRDAGARGRRYNDFSGGYRRHYAKIADEFLQEHLRRPILAFAAYYGLPERGLILLQIQASEIAPGDAAAGARDRAGSVTGQGIHTDGANRAW